MWASTIDQRLAPTQMLLLLVIVELLLLLYRRTIFTFSSTSNWAEKLKIKTMLCTSKEAWYSFSIKLLFFSLSFIIFKRRVNNIFSFDLYSNCCRTDINCRAALYKLIAAARSRADKWREIHFIRGRIYIKKKVATFMYARFELAEHSQREIRQCNST